jgi:ubiquinone/menaquinone biosynthesis C-methylase UbiE
MDMSRSAQVYADFLVPHLSSGSHVLDVGCGSGELSLDLAAAVGWVTGIDVDENEVETARHTAASHDITNADFRVGDAYLLDLSQDLVDAVFAHSVLEALEHPAAAVAEMKRVLKPGGIMGVASVDYSGLILAGPHQDLIRRFYAIRERLWQIEGADPYLGRELRGLLLDAGFIAVVATTTYISYGTTEAVKEFGLGRAEDCDDDWYRTAATEHGLATDDDLAAMRRAWLEWSESPTSYAAFAWCRALGWKA